MSLLPVWASLIFSAVPCRQVAKAMLLVTQKEHLELILRYPCLTFRQDISARNSQPAAEDAGCEHLHSTLTQL